MDEERKKSIETALQTYKQAVQEINFRILRFVVTEIENEAPEELEDCDIPEAELPKLRVELLGKEYGIRIDSPETISSMHDFLSDDKREALVANCSLDGVSHRPVDIEAREAWFADLWDRVTKIDTIQHRPENLPEDLKYLSTLVDGICGPGLPNYRKLHGLSFITALDELNEYGDDRVHVPFSQEQIDSNEYNALSAAWTDWEISVGIIIGHGQRGWAGGYMVYCRHKSQSSRQEWQWRYGLKDKWFDSELYDTVEKFLEWYAHFNEQTEEDIEIFPLAQIL